jgi:hypothetical protein
MEDDGQDGGRTGFRNHRAVDPNEPTSRSKAALEAC